MEDISIFIDICCTWCASKTVCTIVWTVIQSQMLIRKFITNHITIPRQGWNYLVRDSVMMYVANSAFDQNPHPIAFSLSHWLKQRLMEWMAWWFFFQSEIWLGLDKVHVFILTSTFDKDLIWKYRLALHFNLLHWSKIIKYYVHEIHIWDLMIIAFHLLFRNNYHINYVLTLIQIQWAFLLVIIYIQWWTFAKCHDIDVPMACAK